MLFGDAKWELLMKAKRTMTSISLDDGAAGELINDAIMFIYPFALEVNPEFFYTSVPFAAATTITLPADFKEILAIQVTNDNTQTCRMAQARVDTMRQFVTMMANPKTRGTADNPLATLQNGVIQIRPAVKGNLIYTRRPVFVTDNTTELSRPNGGTKPIIPWIYEDTMILKALDYARERHNIILDIQSEVDARLRKYQDAVANMKREQEPLTVFRREIEQPVGMQTQR